MSSRAVPAVAGIRRLVVPIAGSVVGKAVELVTLVALATVVPRLMGPTRYGPFAVVLTVVTIGTTALALGGTTLMARFVPAAPAHERALIARALAGRLARNRALQLGVVSVVTLALAAVDPGRYPPLLTALALLALVLNAAATLALQVGLGLGRSGLWSIRYPLQNAILVVAVLVLYPLAGVTGAVVAIVLSACGAALLGVAAVRGLTGMPTPSIALPDEALRFARFHGTSWALVQFVQRGGVLAVALLAGSDAQTGFAALAIGVAMPATYAVLQLFTVSLPQLSEYDGAFPPWPARPAAPIRGATCAASR